MQRPMICIPITEVTRDGIVNKAKEIRKLKCDLIEWRIDHFAGYEQEVVDIVNELKQVLIEKKLLVTLRTTYEGGEPNGDRFSYVELLKKVAEQGVSDYLDVEIHREGISEIIEIAKKNEVSVVGSYHDFTKTPSQSEIVSLLKEAKSLGVQVGKVACMPQSEEDVLTLLSATEEMKQDSPDFSLITMSMGELGKKSRLYGGLYGSEVTFAYVGEGSAPGQIPIEDVNAVFDKIYCGRKHISLIGFMGVGKSTISRELNHQTGRPEVDTDQRIVEEQGCSIATIFEEKGEPFFRELETALIDELGTEPPSIISCGGGMAIRDLNAKKLQAIGEIVLLTAEPETIYERVKDSTNRPLLNGNMNVDYIRGLMEKRRPFYEKAATIRVATDGKTVSEIAKEIIALV